MNAKDFAAAHSACIQQIVNALREFEAKTGQVVDDLTLQRHESTRFEDVSKRYIRSIVISVMPTPEEWQA